MDTQRMISGIEGRKAGDEEAWESADGFIVQDRVRPIRAARVGRGEARRRLIVLGAFVVGAATSAVVGGVAYRPAAVAPTPALMAAALPATASLPAMARAVSTTRRVSSNGRGLVVSIPTDRDYISSSGIAVAGLAFGRPHGPRISRVRVEVFVAGQLIKSADIAVFSARFAGVIDVSSQIGPAKAELRVSDPANPARPAVIRSVTIQTPASVPKP